MRRGMNSMEMQKNNRILVFKTLQEKGMMTRAELAVELNLQKATITNIINEFFEMGIVEVNGETAAGRRGEKLNLKLDDIYTMSIGITRKDYQLAIFDLSGNMIKHSCCNFQKENGFREIVENLKADAVKYGELIFDVVNASIRQLLNPELTASWEKGLTYVAEGTITPEEYMEKLERFVAGRTYNVLKLNNQYQLREFFEAAGKNYP